MGLFDWFKKKELKEEVSEENKKLEEEILNLAKSMKLLKINIDSEVLHTMPKQQLQIILDFLKETKMKENAAAMNDLAIQLKNEGRYLEALDIYNTLLNDDPDNEAVLQNKAVLLKNMDKASEAIRIYNKLLKKNPHNFGALANKGAALFSAGKDKEAIRYYDMALKINPNEPTLLKNKEDALNTIESEKRLSNKQKGANKSLKAYRLGKFDEAVKYIDGVLKKYPYDKKLKDIKATWLTGKALSLMEKNEYLRALAVLKKCRKFSNNTADVNSVVFTNMGRCYEKLGKYVKALEYYEKALKIDPNNSTVLNNKGYALLLLGKYNESIAYFDKSLNLSPFSVRAFNNKQMALKEKLKRENNC